MIHAAPQGVSALRNHMRAQATAQGQHLQYTTLQTRSALHELGRGLMTGGLSLLAGGLALHAGLSLSGAPEQPAFDGLSLALVGGLGWITGNAITRAHPGQSPRLADWIAAHRQEHTAQADSRTPLGQWVIASGRALYGARDAVHLKVLEQQSRRRRPEQLLIALAAAWSLTGSVWPLIAVTLLCALPWGAQDQAPTFEWPDLVPDDRGEAVTGS